MEILPKSSRNWTCDNSIIENYPIWRFGSYHYYVLQQRSYRLADDFNWALGESFQERTNLLTLPQADFKIITDAGDITLFTGFKEETISAVREALN